MRPRIVLGFSGGVDSAVTAKLLAIAGWDVHCVYLETLRRGRVRPRERGEDGAALRHDRRAR